jgi:hypothetical protein
LSDGRSIGQQHVFCNSVVRRAIYVIRPLLDYRFVMSPVRPQWSEEPPTWTTRTYFKLKEEFVEPRLCKISSWVAQPFRFSSPLAMHVFLLCCMCFGSKVLDACDCKSASCTTLEEKWKGAHRVSPCIRYDRLSAHRPYSLLFIVLLQRLPLANYLNSLITPRRNMASLMSDHLLTPLPKQ